MSRRTWAVLCAFVLVSSVGAALAQTGDGETPAEEQACDKYQGEGARYGLCVAYCEAQDCDDLKKGDVSCLNIAENFVEWSVKKGYVRGPKGVTIDCYVTACTKEDIKYCGGKEQDCNTDDDKECERVCTAKYLGTDEKGNPICVKPPCIKKCVSEIPGIH